MHSLATANPTKEERKGDAHIADDSTVSTGQRPKLTLAFAVKACFSVTKV